MLNTGTIGDTIDMVQIWSVAGDTKAEMIF